MIYNLYCSKDRDYALHSVLNNKEGKIQTIKCLTCEYEQEYVILDRRVAVAKEIHDLLESYMGNV